MKKYKTRKSIPRPDILRGERRIGWEKLISPALSNFTDLGRRAGAAHQAPPSMGFSRQEYWSWVPLPGPHWAIVNIKIKQIKIDMPAILNYIILVVKFMVLESFILPACLPRSGQWTSA